MALVDLKSNLRKSNVYKDTPGGGNSGLPYIKQGLPEDSPAGEYLASIASTSIDTDVRGGLYSVIASTEDTIRVSRFLNDFPRGLAFTSKQIGLQKSNPLIETERRGDVINTQVYNLNSNLLAQIALQGTGEHVPRPGFNVNNLLKDENKYEKIVVKNNNDGQNRLVTLYNTKISTDPNNNNLITNLNKLGISKDPNTLFDYVGGPGSSYGLGNTFIGRAVNTNESWESYKITGYSTTGYFPKDTLTNQLITEGKDSSESQILASGKFNSILRKKFPRKFTTTQITEEFNTNLSLDGNSGNNTGETIDVFVKQENLQLDYLSNLLENVDTSAQQGGTQISGDYIRPEKVPEGMPTINQFGNTMGYSTLLASKKDAEEKGELQDFRQKSIIFNGQGTDYSNKLVNIATRLGIGNPGSRTKEQRQYLNQINNGDGQDKINLIPLYTYDGGDPDPIQGNKVRDMIKFCIEVMDNDSPSKTSPLHFRAYVTDFSDNIGADWNGQKYMGRGENFYTYQGFSREVNFKLTVAAQSKQEMMPLYQKLNFLASSLHPDYSSGGFMRGNLHKLTIGEWFYRMPGILKSMNISIDNNYPWEIKYTEPETSKFQTSDFPTNVTPSNYKNGTSNKGSNRFENSNSDADMMELPQVLSIQFSFIPILNNLPRLAKENGQFTNTPILISNHGIQENFIKRIEN